MFGCRRRTRDEELRRELQAHIDAEAEELEQDGVPPDQAAGLARRMLGNRTAIQEQVRDVWGSLWLERSRQDLQYAWRSFARTPGFTAVVVLTLALGIGITTAMFSMVEAILLNPLPYRDPDRLVVVWQKFKQHPENPPMFDSYRDFEVWQKGAHSFEQLAPATWATGGAILSGSGPARDVLAMPVGVNFFSLLGVFPESGRTFRADDLQHECTVVLKHSFKVATFGTRANVIGRHVRLDQSSCTIVGVMPPGFTFYPDALSMWKLITPDSRFVRDAENANVGVFARLKPGVTMAQAQNELRGLVQEREGKQPKEAEREPVVCSLAEQFAFLSGPNLRFTVVLLFGAVMVVLLIACLNIANLLLGRSLARQKELAVRAALGSGRLRLVHQLLTEGLLLAMAGALPGTLLAAGAVRLFRAVNPVEMPPGNPVRVNMAVLVFTCVLAVGTAFVFGLLPAIRASRVDLADAFRSMGRSAARSRTGGRASKLLVAAEMMLSLVLLVGAGLLMASIDRLASVPLGFRTEGVVSSSVVLPEWRYGNNTARANFFRDALERTARLPGVQSVAFASTLPLSNGRWGGNALAREGHPAPGPAASRDVSEASISPDYFRVMSVPLLRGKPFDARDRLDSPAVAIVNRELASKYFPGEDPIGQRIRVGQPATDQPWVTIVGVAGNETDKDFFHEMSWQNVPTVFRPIDQSPSTGSTLVLKTTRDAERMGIPIARQLASLDPSVAVGEVRTLDSQLSHLLAYPRFRAFLVSAFAALALLLAGIGLYGVMSQATLQRTPEFGVRLALGAERRHLLGLVLRDAFLLTGSGMLCGVGIAYALTRSLGTLLYGIQPGDPALSATAGFVLFLVAIAAALGPACRAARTDPAVTLRYE